MGMSASQARYLTLSARKTNTEYEGQQLNQQRLNLANQSADLFNQMLTMSVPTCPDSNDFTKVQYSWSDGINDEVISDYYQISIPNEDYNYVVTSYHNEKVYTGQSKRMNAPEIQHSKTNQFTDKPDKTYKVTQSAYHKESQPGAGDDSYTIDVERGTGSDIVKSTHVFKRMDKTKDSIEEVDAFTKRTTKVTAGDKATHTDASPAVAEVTDPKTGQVITPAQDAVQDNWKFQDAITMKFKMANKDFDPTKEQTEGKGNPGDADYVAPNMPYMEQAVTIPAGTAFNKIDFDDENNRAMINQLLAVYGDKYDSDKSYYATALTTDGQPLTFDAKGNPTNALKDSSGNIMYAFICGDDMEAASGSQGDIAKVEVRTGDNTAYYSDGTYILTASELSSIDLTDPDSTNWLDQIYFHREENNPIYSNFTAVGNCDLNAISLDTYNSNQDMQIEIQQVIKDMLKNGNNVAYGNLEACFDSTTGEYKGGLYSFKMYDHTYYTTKDDLATAVAGAYRENATATNGIDSQNKFCYYTSTYITQKIQDTKKALMETDGKGRFSSVKFEDDDTVYTLNCETVTDEDAYRNAMNAYYYKQEQYDKAVADINAKTEIIQAEDRELQLRLEQLGTEQTALQTEMEACQKVVSKSIESTFKTFGG